MRGLARDGVAILMISSEMPELIGLADRILVMRNGELAGELPAGAAETEIMDLAAADEHVEVGGMSVREPQAAGPGAATPAASAARALRVGQHPHAAITNSPATPVYGALLGVFVLAWIIVTIDGGTFLTVNNIVGMLQRSVALGIVSAGQTVVILAGSLDLSVALPDQPQLAARRRDDGRAGRRTSSRRSSPCSRSA